MKPIREDGLGQDLQQTVVDDLCPRRSDGFRQTVRQAVRQIDRQTDGLTDRLNNILKEESKKIVQFHMRGVTLRSKIKRYIEGELFFKI